MFKRFRARNYESHRDTVVDFHPGVNIFVGSSDEGKSALFRALKKLIENRPLGDAFHSWFASEKESTELELTTWEDDKIVYCRQGGDSVYQLNGELLGSLGPGVPDEVKDVLGLGSYNLASQFDRYFLLQDSPGEVSRRLNSVVRLDDINEARTKINRLEYENEEKIKKYKKDIPKLEEDVKAFDHLSGVEKIVDRLDIDFKELVEVEQKIDSLGSLLKGLDETRDSIRELDGWLKIEEEYKQLSGLVREYEEIEGRISGLSVLLDNIQRSQSRVAQLDDFLKSEDRLNSLLEDLAELKTQNTQIDSLKILLGNLDVVKKKRIKVESGLERLLDEYAGLIREHGICPTCFTGVDEEMIQQILENL